LEKYRTGVGLAKKNMKSKLFRWFFSLS